MIWLLAQLAPAAHDPIQVSGGDRPLVYGALAGAIVALATVITILWRRGERRNDRQIKGAEEALAREVARTEALAARAATERGEFVKALESQREAFAQLLGTQRELDRSQLDRQRQEFEATLRHMVERQAASDVARDGKIAELLTQLGRVVESVAPRRRT